MMFFYRSRLDYRNCLFQTAAADSQQWIRAPSVKHFKVLVYNRAKMSSGLLLRSDCSTSLHGSESRLLTGSNPGKQTLNQFKA